MRWFRTRQETKEHDHPMDVVAMDSPSKIEVVAHKKATQKQINEVKKVNKTLNEQLLANGFTLKIYLATGRERSVGANKHG